MLYLFALYSEFLLILKEKKSPLGAGSVAW
jgi:hypothetical protein